MADLSNIPNHTIKLGFDPKTQDPILKKIFSNAYARTMWCCIRRQHITDQFFNKKILWFVEDFNDLQLNKKLNYYSFHRLTLRYFRDFGRCNSRKMKIAGYLWHITGDISDRKFWLQTYKYMCLKPLLKCTVN